jgi:hypothetical protein
MLRKLFAFLAAIPLAWCLREITKTAIFDWVTKRLESAIGLEEAQMIAFISTYAIPLAASAVIIVSVYLVAARKSAPSPKPLAFWGARIFGRTQRKMATIAGGNPPTLEPKGAAPEMPTAASAALPTLRRHYEEDDRRRLSGVLYELYTLLNETVSPPQVAVHELLRELPYRVRSGESGPIKARLSELRTVFSSTREELIQRFMLGSHYYADEIGDITSNRDELSAEIWALDQYISILDALPEKASETLINLMQPHQATLRDANFALGNWVSRCNERIRAKRNALQ